MIYINTPVLFYEKIVFNDGAIDTIALVLSGFPEFIIFTHHKYTNDTLEKIANYIELYIGVKGV